jgi:hypothetical protein
LHILEGRDGDDSIPDRGLALAERPSRARQGLVPLRLAPSACVLGGGARRLRLEGSLSEAAPFGLQSGRHGEAALQEGGLTPEQVVPHHRVQPLQPLDHLVQAARQVRVRVTQGGQARFERTDPPADLERRLAADAESAFQAGEDGVETGRSLREGSDLVAQHLLFGPQRLHLPGLCLDLPSQPQLPFLADALLPAPFLVVDQSLGPLDLQAQTVEGRAAAVLVVVREALQELVGRDGPLVVPARQSVAGGVVVQKSGLEAGRQGRRHGRTVRGIGEGQVGDERRQLVRSAAGEPLECEPSAGPAACRPLGVEIVPQPECVALGRGHAVPGCQREGDGGGRAQDVDEDDGSPAIGLLERAFPQGEQAAEAGVLHQPGWARKQVVAQDLRERGAGLGGGFALEARRRDGSGIAP